MEIRIGMVGAGQIGEDHVRRITEKISGARVTAVASRSRGPAERVAALCGARVEPDVQSLLRAEDVDAVILASPSERHEEQVLWALEAGKPVFWPLRRRAAAGSCRPKSHAASGWFRSGSCAGMTADTDSSNRRSKVAPGASRS